MRNCPPLLARFSIVAALALTIPLGCGKKEEPPKPVTGVWEAEVSTPGEDGGTHRLRLRRNGTVARVPCAG